MALFNDIYLNLRAFLRFFKFLFVIGAYFISAVRAWTSTADPDERRRRLIENGHQSAKRILRAFNVELICKQNISEDECSLLVGNHIGFIDIVCLVALRPAVFITSLEMKNTPVLGQITDLGGCAYVDRKSRMSIQDELKDIVKVLKQGFRVVLYAESVASNGEQVLPFKKTLMTAAGLSGKPIRPFVFNFVKVNGGPVLYEHRDSVCWYGDQQFHEAIWRSLKLDSLVCEIEFLPLVEVAPDVDRTKLAHQVHHMVAAKYVPFKPDMNLESQIVATPKADAI